ncbi:nuclease [Lentinula aff. detonsa]|uniref:Nuclease n=1 Tax=Lentinula aff. detonsa TaxID=2804958 RepID=A0AA38L4G6_9AGAR|nr:nuclease [Lentinula aff. detonsa]
MTSYASDNTLTPPTPEERCHLPRAYYDNNKPYGESETITLYIYNGGPDTAVAPVVTAGYTHSMNYDAVTTSLRQAQEYLGQQPSVDLNSFNWTNLSSPSTHYVGWNMITTLPNVSPGTILELGLTFPMTHEESYDDDTISASVLSSTSDPRNQNNSTTYIITPNHHNDGSAYWNTPGDLGNLDFNGLTSAQALSQADLRIASSRARYNNNLPYGQSETLSLLVFNAGPTIAMKPVLTAGYTTSMDETRTSSSGQQVWIPDGTDPSTYLQGNSSSTPLQWQTLDGVAAPVAVGGQKVVVSLPDIPPSILYRISIAFPMNKTPTYTDYTVPASISSQAQELDPSNNSTTGDNDPAQIPLRQLEGQIRTTQIISFAPQSGKYQPKVVTGIEYDTSSSGRTVSFSADGKIVQSYVAHPDTLVYLDPFELNVGQDKLRVGCWIPVRMLWAGAGVRGRSSTGGKTTAYVTDIRIDTSGDQLQSAEPEIVSMSHSYVVGTLQEGGILTHNPKDHERCGHPNNIAILLAISVLANNLVATTTPPPNNPDPPHGYSLRHRRPNDPIPPRIPAPPVLPMDVPRRDDEGNWLIYLYEEDTPAAVENARTAVYEFRQPSVLTYDPNGNAARRRQSTGQYQSQRELLQLTGEEASGSTGTLGQLDRDEYPPAIAAEGGQGALVTYIEAGDNRRAGSLMGQQFNNYRMDPQPDGHAPLRQGDRFRYAIIHENMFAVEYLGDGIDEDQLEEPPID